MEIDMSNENKDKMSSEQENEDQNEEKKIVEMIFTKFKFENVEYVDDNRNHIDAKTIIENLSSSQLDQLIRLNVEANEDQSQPNVQYSKNRLQSLIDEALKKRIDMGQDPAVVKDDGNR